MVSSYRHAILATLALASSAMAFVVACGDSRRAFEEPASAASFVGDDAGADAASCPLSCSPDLRLEFEGKTFDVAEHARVLGEGAALTPLPGGELPPGALAAILTRKGNKQVVLAPRASEVNEAAREVPAAQIPAKLVLNVPRERSVVRRAGVPEEVRPVLLHDTIEHRCVRLARQVRRRKAGHLPAFALGVPSTLPRIPFSFHRTSLAPARSCRPWAWRRLEKHEASAAKVGLFEGRVGGVAYPSHRWLARRSGRDGARLHR